MKTFKKYLEAKNPVTGETFADYCDRTGIGFQGALRSYRESGEALDRTATEPDPLFDAVTAAPCELSWGEYADNSGITVRSFMETCERTGMYRTDAEKAAERSALCAAWDARVKPTLSPWLQEVLDRPARPAPTSRPWMKSAAEPLAPATGPGPA